MTQADRFGARAELAGGIDYFRLSRLQESGVGDPSRLPVTVKVMLENALRHAGASFANEDDVAVLTAWDGRPPAKDRERPFVPSRVLLQDFTGVPAVVDLAAMRSAMERTRGDPARIDPLVPVDLVVDHSVQVDAFGDERAYGRNIEREYERNKERYTLLRWAQVGFNGFRVVPPGMGIAMPTDTPTPHHAAQKTRWLAGFDIPLWLIWLHWVLSIAYPPWPLAIGRWHLGGAAPLLGKTCFGFIGSAADIEAAEDLERLADFRLSISPRFTDRHLVYCVQETLRIEAAV